MLSLMNVGDHGAPPKPAELVGRSRWVEGDVVAHMGEAKVRRLYAREACSSMFDYCTRVLRLRENEAYLRITVAQTPRALGDQQCGFAATRGAPS